VIPIEAARWILTDVGIAASKAGRKLNERDLRRARKRVVEMTGCKPAFARQCIREVLEGQKIAVEPAPKKKARKRK